MRPFRLLVLGLGALALATPAFSGLAGAEVASPFRPAQAASSKKADPASGIGGPFSLVDHHGQRVNDREFRGRWMLVFFGYTYCPDICPTNLVILSTALESLGEAGKKVVPLFITLDPDRDTPEVLSDYVGHFHPRLIGLTGTSEEIAQVAQLYRVHYEKVYFAKVQDGEAASEYLVDHSGYAYLMGPGGRLRAVLGGSPEDPGEIMKRHLADE